MASTSIFPFHFCCTSKTFATNKQFCALHNANNMPYMLQAPIYPTSLSWLQNYTLYTSTYILLAIHWIKIIEINVIGRGGGRILQNQPPTKNGQIACDDFYTPFFLLLPLLVFRFALFSFSLKIKQYLDPKCTWNWAATPWTHLPNIFFVPIKKKKTKLENDNIKTW